MKEMGSFILIALFVIVASFAVSAGWRLGEKAVLHDGPEKVIVILPVQVPQSSVTQ